MSDFSTEHTHEAVCPYCGEEPDMEIGPDEEMPKVVETAKLLQVVNGEACIACGQCELRCPDYAIFVDKKVSQ